MIAFTTITAQGIEVLSALGIKAVFFQTSGLVDGQELIWEHQLYWYSRSDQVAARLLRVANEVLSSMGLAPIAHQNNVALHCGNTSRSMSQPKS